MNVKITTPEQVAGLQKGDILFRGPCEDTATENAPGKPNMYKDTYEIQSVNKIYNVYSLIQANFRTMAFASPVDIGRLFIKGPDLVNEKNWWICT